MGHAINQALSDRIQAKGAKKILTCDGGDAGGIITVEILARMEAQLRQELGRDEHFVLADYFDFVGGTSIGAVVAALVALGLPMPQIRAFFADGVMPVLLQQSAHFRKGGNGTSAKVMREQLITVLGPMVGHDVTLGSKALRTMLLMVLRNASTNSPWVLCNNPFAKYNHPDLVDCNLSLLLGQLMLANIAAQPDYPIEKIRLPDGKVFGLRDGRLTIYNNPAFLAFQMATTTPYHINWPTGIDQMLVVAVGTGNMANQKSDPAAYSVFNEMGGDNLSPTLFNAASVAWDMACRTIGRCRVGAMIDGEFGDMVLANSTAPSNWSGAKQFTYLRYNPELTEPGMLDLGLSGINLQSGLHPDLPRYFADMQRVGVAYASKYVLSEHWHGFLGDE